MKRLSVIGLVMFLVMSLAVVASAKPAEPVPDSPHQSVGNMKFFTTAGPLDKDEVGKMVQTLLDLPKRLAPADAADAVAVALCHIARVPAARAPARPTRIEAGGRR